MKTKIKTNELKTRDHLMVKVINGATKGGPHKDRRKEQDKTACRKKVRGEEG
jgi:hypothetical protein